MRNHRSLASLFLLVGCGAGSGTAAGGGTVVEDAGDHDATGPVDGLGDDAGSHEAGTPPGDVPAGKSGADAFCAKLCAHEQRCAAGVDAAPPGLTNCMPDCQMANEASTTNPPTELLRADYVDALASCIAASSCGEPLSTSEATCAEGIAVGNGDAGGHALAPTQAAQTFCHDLETSICFVADSGAPDCLSSFAFFSDVTLKAAISCFTDATCSAVVTCNSAAFTQP